LRDPGLKFLGKHPTPELKKGLALINACPKALAEAARDRINLGMVKDLALLGASAADFLEQLACMEGTVGQKREIAFLLKILFIRKKELPSPLPVRADAAILMLKAQARPELEARLAEFKRLLEKLSVRRGVVIQPPEAFEEPGFYMNLHITSENLQEILDSFDKNADILRDLACKLP